MNNVPTLVPKMKGKDNLKQRRVINRKPVDSLPVDFQEHVYDASSSDDDKSGVILYRINEKEFCVENFKNN